MSEQLPVEHRLRAHIEKALMHLPRTIGCETVKDILNSALAELVSPSLSTLPLLPVEQRLREALELFASMSHTIVNGPHAGKIRVEAFLTNEQFGSFRAALSEPVSTGAQAEDDGRHMRTFCIRDEQEEASKGAFASEDPSSQNAGEDDGKGVEFYKKALDQAINFGDIQRSPEDEYGPEYLYNELAAWAPKDSPELAAYLAEGATEEANRA